MEGKGGKIGWHEDTLAGADLERGSAIGAHAHPWHQLVYVSAGLAVVTTSAGTWMAPPSWAVWVPAEHSHSIRFAGASELRTIYLRPGWWPDLPPGCRTYAVSPLLRELLLRAVAIGMLDRRDSSEAALARLIAGELAGSEGGRPGPPAFRLPHPSSKALVAMVRTLEQGRVDMTTAALARATGLSVRTLERRFATETGMTLGQWRQHRALLRGLEQIATGASVKAASAIAGYRSPSAFIVAFRKAFGTSPGRYF